MGKLTIKVHEAKDDKFVPYTMMQYYVPDEKKWDPIIVEINSNDKGWFYDGLAVSDNFGNFSYDEFNWDFIHQRCRKGTDKCDPELVAKMEKYYLSDTDGLADGYTFRKVNGRLGAYTPKGLPYIGK